MRHLPRARLTLAIAGFALLNPPFAVVEPTATAHPPEPTPTVVEETDFAQQLGEAFFERLQEELAPLTDATPPVPSTEPENRTDGPRPWPWGPRDAADVDADAQPTSQVTPSLPAGETPTPTIEANLDSPSDRGWLWLVFAVLSACLIAALLLLSRRRPESEVDYSTPYSVDRGGPPLEVAPAPTRAPETRTVLDLRTPAEQAAAAGALVRQHLPDGCGPAVIEVLNELVRVQLNRAADPATLSDFGASNWSHTTWNFELSTLTAEVSADALRSQSAVIPVSTDRDVFVDWPWVSPVSVEGDAASVQATLEHICAQIDDVFEVVRIGPDISVADAVSTLTGASGSAPAVVAIPAGAKCAGRGVLLSAVPLAVPTRVMTKRRGDLIAAVLEPFGTSFTLPAPRIEPVPVAPVIELAVDGVPAPEKLARIMEPRPVEVRLLGGRVELNGITLRKTAKATAILSYLAFHRQPPIDDLHMEFFADKPGRNALDTAIGNLRLKLGTDSSGEQRLVTDRDARRYILSDDVGCDWHRFLALTTAADDASDVVDELAYLDAAVGWLNGPPARAMQAEAKHYRWLRDEPITYHHITRTLVDAARRLANLHLEAGRHDEAQAAGEAALRVVETDEESWRLLMRIAAAAGSREDLDLALAGAQKQAEALDPDNPTAVQPETEDLYEELAEQINRDRQSRDVSSAHG